MARNLPLVFALALAGALLAEHGAKLFAGSFSGGDSGDGSSGTPSPGDVGLSPGSAPAAGGSGIGDVTPQMLATEAALYGWGTDQIAAWRELISDESGGRANAVNPHSRAWGIGQFLGGTLRAYAGKGATSSQPGPQLHAMGAYVHDRYGTPEAALAHENQHHWY